MSLANPKRTQLATNDSTEIGEMVPKSALPTRDGTPPTITLPMLTEREYAALKAIMARTVPHGVDELDVRDLILGHPVVDTDTCPKCHGPMRNHFGYCHLDM